MCDFCSTSWRMVGQSVQMCHEPGNSHAGAISAAGWPVNQPNRVPTIFEAEWDGSTPDIPDGCVRNWEGCPEAVLIAIRRLYRQLHEALTESKHLAHGGVFGDLGRWSDVWARVKTLPAGVRLPKHIDGDLELRRLTAWPEGVRLPEHIGGYLYLNSLTVWPEGVRLPKRIGGGIYLDGRWL